MIAAIGNDHDELPGAEPDELTDKDEQSFERTLALRQARNRAMDREGWIADEFTFLFQQIQALRATRRPKGNARVYFASAAEVLKAVDAAVIDKNEARKLLGLPKRRQPAALRRKRAGK